MDVYINKSYHTCRSPSKRAHNSRLGGLRQHYTNKNMLLLMSFRLVLELSHCDCTNYSHQMALFLVADTPRNTLFTLLDVKCSRAFCHANSTRDPIRY